MRLVCGWGINDADYPVALRDGDGKQNMCPIYRCWKHMIERCYSSIQYPTYIGCRVDERWKYFMAFRAWYLEQAPKSGDQLDKDFLGDGKLYSPETCCFVPRWLNTLFIDCGLARGEWPQGVSYHKSSGKYRSIIRRSGKYIHLGYFDTPEEASEVYLKAKAAYVEELLIEFPQLPRIAAGVRRKMTELIEQEERIYV